MYMYIYALKIQNLVSSISNTSHFKALKFLPQSKHNKNTLNSLNKVISHMKFWQSYSFLPLKGVSKSLIKDGQKVPLSVLLLHVAFFVTCSRNSYNYRFRKNFLVKPSIDKESIKLSMGRSTIPVQENKIHVHKVTVSPEDPHD